MINNGKHNAKDQRRPKYSTINPKIEIITLDDLIDKDEGIKLINVYCDGIKFVIKLVDAEAIIIKIRAKFVINKLSNFPIISVGFVKILGF